jgi:hypothetical protein
MRHAAHGWARKKSRELDVAHAVGLELLPTGDNASIPGEWHGLAG